jgi:serine/threonine protein kinase
LKLSGLLKKPDTDEETAFTDQYEIEQLIGEGATSRVYSAQSKNSDRLFAVKVIPTKVILSESFRAIAREIQILKRLHHPNVITLHDAIITSKNLYIVMDLLQGPELFDVIVDRKFFPELEARALIRKILKAVAYFHSENITHRDIKPENIKFQSESSDAELKILDFGFARHLNKDELLQNQVGTICYEAPEVLRGYTQSFPVDMWAVGIISYIMLCGFPPFFSSPSYKYSPEALQRYPFWLLFNEDTQYLRNSIMEGKFDFPDPYWTNITAECKDLITKLLCVDRIERLTAEQALLHPWFK